jgi:uncharacterized repeat protein (TIGR03803 family)
MSNAHPASISKIFLRAGSLALAFSAFGLFAAVSAQAQTYTVLHTFRGAPDGIEPLAGLLSDGKGNLYGTTEQGGVHICKTQYYSATCGTVFEIEATGKETVLYSFDGRHGRFPGVLLTGDAEGNLYGTTGAGGLFNYGTVFKVAPTGQHSVLYNFPGGSGESYPGEVVRDSTGNLYGAASMGPSAMGSSVLFKLDTAGKESVLYRFTCPACSQTGIGGFGFPGGLTRDPSGNFYGTASGGTGCGRSYPCGGVVYKVSKAGTGTDLYNFTGGANGWAPTGNLTMDAEGNLYGTTLNPDGSACQADECGTVFKVEPSGKETVLYTFQGGTDGGYPNGGLVRDAQGNLYGTTWIGGGNYGTCNPYSMPVGCGVVYKLDPSGKLTTLHIFSNLADGGYPNGDLVMDEEGNLYGTTTSGGDPTCNCGVVFKVTP